MKNPSKISHPLKNRTGTSQRTRIKQALKFDSAPIDGKTLADRLYLISEYAQQINFYEYNKNAIENQELSNWVSFFKNSLPFRLAILSKASINELESEYNLLADELKINPSKQSLESLLEFVFNKIITPVTVLFSTVDKAENSFTIPLSTLIRSTFVDPLKSFISIYNSSVTFLCIEKKSFTNYMTSPWLLKVDEVYALDSSIQQVTKGKKEAFLKAGKIINTIFYQMLSGLDSIIQIAPDYIEESLMPLEESLQKKHESHLALLFTFLELFKHFQGNINELGKKHLDFFYEKVLKMIPKAEVPDKAHIVFEVAKHLDAYPLPKDLLLKDGKDLNKQDIRFGLDHEIILDKAKVTDLRTFSLYPSENNSELIEGIYMSPVANSVDGKGKKFKEDEANNWATLGSKYSKVVKEVAGGDPIIETHPNARLGFVLASPVLLLGEGKRSIKIVLNCDFVFNNIDEKVLIESCLPEFIRASNNKARPIFKVWFSGEKEWIPAVPAISASNPSGKIEFTLDIVLEPEIDPVTFFDEIVLKEKINLKKSQPVVKIELNEEVKIGCGASTIDSDCCLKKKSKGNLQGGISPYNFLKHLKLVDASIDVKVCGVKNLIVQNDEGALDIKSQLFPFGLRPEVPGFDPMNQLEPDENVPKCGENPNDNNPSCLGPSFYIGSKEVLYKKWNSVRVNLEWKDKPDSFNDHYKAYLKINKDLNVPTDINNLGLNEADFHLRIGKLKNGSWNNLSKIDLFEKTVSNFGDLDCETTVYGWEVQNTGVNRYIDYNQPIDFFKNSLNGFLRFTLADQDFLHKEYPFVLARQMLAYANIEANGNKKLTDAIYIEESGKTVIHPFTDYLDKGIGELLEDVKTAFQPINTLVTQIYDVIKLNNSDTGDVVSSIKNLEDEFQNIINILTTPGDPATIIANVVNIITNDILDNGPVDVSAENAKNVFGGLLSQIGDGVDEGLKGLIKKAEEDFTAFYDRFVGSNILNFFNSNSYQALIPNEPWTPIIKNLYVDYSASAEKSDMDIIHLYPYENTSRHENIQSNPTLFPFYDNEGTLFIGIEEITVGGSLSILFQLAEATADSELDRAKIEWFYLTNNIWVKLRTDFDVISDETDGLTVSGIVTIAVPDDINKEGNTQMPDDKYWIKVIAPLNTKAIAETIGIHTQAAKTSARLNELNDRSRLNTSIEAGGIAKLVEGDFSVKKVEQLYPTFGGKTPEAGGHFYTRVSEHLKHKGRTLMIDDYEKIVLEGFPEIYKAKSISHTMGLSAHTYRRDLEIAPGYIVVTVIPDLTKLKAGNQLEPKAPLSLLEKIADHIRSKTSPFARLKVMNPRYEYVNVSISVRLYRGKSSNFYKQKLKEDLTLFLAPWFLGDSEKLAFGQNIIFSDVVGFVEQLDYVDFISNLQLKGECDQTGSIIRPLTARSVLTAGKMCVNINEESCPGQETNNDESCFEPVSEEISPKPETINKLSESI